MSKTSYEDKVEAIKRIKNGEAGINGTARKLGIHPETLRSWIRQDDIIYPSDKYLHRKKGLLPFCNDYISV